MPECAGSGPRFRLPARSGRPRTAVGGRVRPYRTMGEQDYARERPSPGPLVRGARRRAASGSGSPGEFSGPARCSGGVFACSELLPAEKPPCQHHANAKGMRGRIRSGEGTLPPGRHPPHRPRTDRAGTAQLLAALPMEEGVLGRCWACGGCRGPVLVPPSLALVEGRTRARDQNTSRRPRPGGHRLLRRRSLPPRRLPDRAGPRDVCPRGVFAARHTRAAFVRAKSKEKSPNRKYENRLNVSTGRHRSVNPDAGRCLPARRAPPGRSTEGRKTSRARRPEARGHGEADGTGVHGLAVHGTGRGPVTGRRLGH